MKNLVRFGLLASSLMVTGCTLLSVPNQKPQSPTVTQQKTITPPPPPTRPGLKTLVQNTKLATSLLPLDAPVLRQAQLDALAYDFNAVTTSDIEIITFAEAQNLEIVTTPVAVALIPTPAPASPSWDTLITDINATKTTSQSIYLAAQNAAPTDGSYTYYYNTISAGLQAGVQGITLPHLNDTSAQKAHLFDSGLTRKPAYYGVHDALSTGNRFKVSALGTCGGETLTLKINNKEVTSWVLSKKLADYSYPWLNETSKITLIEKRPKQKPTCPDGKRPAVKITTVMAYGKTYKHTSLRTGGGVVIKEYGTVTTPSSLPKKVASLAIAKSSYAAIVQSNVISWTKSVTDTKRNDIQYNVYRKNNTDGFWQRLNSTPLGDTAYTDTTAPDGKNWYAVTAADAKRQESPLAITSIK